MKFFALATIAVLPLAMAYSVPAVMEKRDICLDFNANATLATLTNLIGSGEIEISGPADEHDKRSIDSVDSIEKRSDVPGLHCGYARALRCVGATAGTLNSCIWAVISFGRDIKQDAGCISAIAASGSNLPNDCKLCLGIA